MRLGQDVLSDLPAALAREWVLANGLGGSAAGTAAGAHTRRVHALLTVAEPAGRLTTLLLKLDERLTVAGESYELACNLHADGVVRPHGHLLLEEFRLDPWPVWRYRAGETVIEKSLLPIQWHNAVAVAYRHLAGPDGRLAVSPLVAARDPFALQRQTPEVVGATQGVPGRVRIEIVPGRPALTLWHSGSFIPARLWQRALRYPLDGATAGEACEDAFVPGHVEGAIGPGCALQIVASAEDDLFRALAHEDRLGSPPPKSLAECVAALDHGGKRRHLAWRRAALEGADFTARQAAAAHGGPGEQVALRRKPLVNGTDPWVELLAQALQGGLVQRAHRSSLVPPLAPAGERPGDALRALPGLIALRAFDAAREVLHGALEYLSQGLLPGRFDPGDGTPLYGDPEPALWLVCAGELYARRSEDLEFLRDPLYPALESVMQSYRAGAPHGIRVDADGLLGAGEGARAAKRADLNALWYHALVAIAQLARLIGRKENGAFYLAWAREHQKVVNLTLWDDAVGCLFESLTPEGPVRGLSPSQLLAVSLAPALLPSERAARLLATVERELFTPLGLRASPGDDRVAPAWLGPFISAYLRVHGRSTESQARVGEWLEMLRAELERGAHGQVPTSIALVPGPPGDLLLGAPGPPRVDRGAAEARPAARARRGRPSAVRNPAPDADPRGDPAPHLDVAGPFSVVAAAELLRAWIEEVDHTLEPAATPV